MSQSYSNYLGSGIRRRSPALNITKFGSGLTNHGNMGQIVDGSTTDDSYWVSGSDANASGWLITFNGPARIMDGFKYYLSSATAFFHGTWAIEAYNGSSWVELTTFTSAATATQEHTWTNTTAYNEYRIIGRSGSSPDAGPYIREWEFRLDDISSRVITGDKTSIITMTSDLTIGGNPPLSTWINGNYTTVGFYPSNGQSGKYLQFEFSAAVELEYAMLTHHAGSLTSQGTWKWQRWDGSAWQDLTTAAVWYMYSETEARPEGYSWWHFTNRASCTRYRMLQTAGTTSSAPDEYEFDFIKADSVAGVNLAPGVLVDDTVIDVALASSMTPIDLAPGALLDETIITAFVRASIWTALLVEDPTINLTLTVSPTVLKGWQPFNSTAGCVITDYNRRVDTPVGGYNGTRTRAFPTSGKYYIEISSINMQSDGDWLGVANQYWSLGSLGDANVVAIGRHFSNAFSGFLRYGLPDGSGSSPGNVVGGLDLPLEYVGSNETINGSLHTVRIALDMDRRKIYFTIDAQPFKRTDLIQNFSVVGFPVDDPDNNTGGITVPGGDVSLAARLLVDGDGLGIVHKTTQQYNPPAGYVRWDGTDEEFLYTPAELVWDPAAIGGSLLLSDDKTTITNISDHTRSGARSFTRHLLDWGGKWYAELQDVVLTNADAFWKPGFIGVTSENWDWSDGDYTFGSGAHEYSANGSEAHGDNHGTITAGGHTIRLAIWITDPVNTHLWWSIDGGAWNAYTSGTQDPVTGAGGIQMSVGIWNDNFYLHLCAAIREITNHVTLAVAEDAFLYTTPDGYLPWDHPSAPPMEFDVGALTDDATITAAINIGLGRFSAYMQDQTIISINLYVWKLFQGDIQEDGPITVTLTVANPLNIEVALTDDSVITAAVTLPMPINIEADLTDDSEILAKLTRGMGTQSTQSQVVLHITGR